MANSWGGKVIILDTANDDAAYTAAHDAVNGGTKYNTGKVKIMAIKIVDGANTNGVELIECSTSSVTTGRTIFKTSLETGDLNPFIYFAQGFWAQGICPKTLGGSTKIHIYVC